MKAVVRPSEVQGQVEAPPSKSLTHRMAILGALAPGESVVNHPLICDDTLATLNALKALGIVIREQGDKWVIRGGDLAVPSSVVDCGESGTTMRLMTAVCSLVDGKVTLDGGASLRRRPMQPLLDALKQLGVGSTSDGGRPPVTMYSESGLKGGVASIRGDVSSQFISALLIVAPLAESPVEIRVITPLQSKPYVSMTMGAMKVFDTEAVSMNGMQWFTTPVKDYTPRNVTVEGDWSSASYPLAAGALAGSATVKGLKPTTIQADKNIIELLTTMGATITMKQGKVTVERDTLKAIDCDLSDAPDLFPIISALCTQAEGTSTLHGLNRLQWKESDRVEAMTEGIKGMGGEITKEDDMVRIRGSPLKGALVDPYNDHRIAMSLAVLGLVSEGQTTIRDAECVAKSYPGFWEHLKALGAEVERHE
jgi:3-phosphoshikimate 1-carboxyvinyltransferase